MSSQPDLAHLRIEEFAERFRREMAPLTGKFSYFAAAIPMSEEEAREYLQDPIAALPPAIVKLLPNVSILLAPYLERNGRGEKTAYISMDKPAEQRQMFSSQFISKEGAVMAFALRDQEVAEYHYLFYRAVAELVAAALPDEAETRFFGMLREELSNRVHGEVDEDSWRAKQALLRRQTTVRRDTKGFREYARLSFVDTLTLYLHGICCDIDVDTGPRQLPSRFLRKRLELLEDLFPPPPDYAVFPEELNGKPSEN
jgi:hypothetical protein